MTTFADVCSGISSATLAWLPLGWKCVFYSEIEKFPAAVLKHHYPGTPNYGDIRDHGRWPAADIDVLLAGTPCQGFSIAGRRAGLDDARSNLALAFGEVASRYQPTWIVWENVPGVRSLERGKDFAAFVSGLGELGYGVCWRSLDAQFADLAQRRERLYLVGYLGDWRPAAAVLFNAESLHWDNPPRRQAGQGVARPIASCPDGGSGYRNDADTADNLIAFAGGSADGQLAGTVSSKWVKGSGGPAGDECYNLLAFDAKASGKTAHSVGELPGTLRGEGHGGGHAAIAAGPYVRRLTCREAERLQGLPDDFTRIPWRRRPAEACPDGPRYRAIGNAIPVPDLAWIGRRIMLCEELLK